MLCCGYFGDGGLMNYLPWLALIHDPSDLSIPRSWDYRHEPLAPSLFTFFMVSFEATKFSIFIKPNPSGFLLLLLWFGYHIQGHIDLLLSFFLAF
jgi:hypothetical protein